MLFARLCITAAAVGILKETLELGDQVAWGEGPTKLFGAFLRQRTRAEKWIRTILAGIVYVQEKYESKLLATEDIKSYLAVSIHNENVFGKKVVTIL